jgi:acetyl-CoA carboxylase biotin carboxyl carrier protein
LNLKELKEILSMLESAEITEFELEEEGRKLRVRRVGAAPTPTPGAPPAPTINRAAPAAVPLTASGMPPVPATGPSPEAPAAPPTEGAASEEGVVIAKSPIVGIFFRSPDPNSPPFVSVGDQVKVGQVLCIIEAMKLMNEIEAEVGGEIVKIHHENGQPVQFGEPLFSIRTTP